MRRSRGCRGALHSTENLRCRRAADDAGCAEQADADDAPCHALDLSSPLGDFRLAM